MKPTATRELASRLQSWLTSPPSAREGLTRQLGAESAAVLARLETRLAEAKGIAAMELRRLPSLREQRGTKTGPDSKITAQWLADGLDVMPHAARILARTCAEWLYGQTPRRWAFEELLVAAWSVAEARGNAGTRLSNPCLQRPGELGAVETKREEASMATCLGGWQTGEMSFREIAPLVIERIPGLEHGPPYAPGVVAKIAGLADSNRPTVYGVIRDLRGGRSVDDPLRPQGATATPPASVSNGKHEPPAAPVESAISDREPAKLPPALTADMRKLLALLPAMYSGRDLVASFADFIGALREKIKTLESELRETRAANPGPAADSEAENALREDLARQSAAIDQLQAAHRTALSECFAQIADLEAEIATKHAAVGLITEAFAEEPADLVHIPGGCDAAFEVGALTDEEGGETTCLRCLNDELLRVHSLLVEKAAAIDELLGLPAEQPQRPVSTPEAHPAHVALDALARNGARHPRPQLTGPQCLDVLRLAAGVGQIPDVHDLPLWSETLARAAMLTAAVGEL